MGFVKDAVEGVGSVIGDTIGEVPVVGDVVEAGLPIAGSIFGGPVGGALGGALSGGMSGGGIESVAKRGLAGLAGGFTADQFKQMQADQERARELANRGAELGQQSADIAMQQFNRNAPMRQSFRQGAMSFFDPTNPLANPVQQTPMMSSPRRAAPQAQVQMPQEGTLSERVAGVLNRDREIPNTSGNSFTRQSGRMLEPVQTPASQAQRDENFTTLRDGAGGGRGFGGMNISQVVQDRLPDSLDHIRQMAQEMSPEEMRQRIQDNGAAFA